MYLDDVKFHLSDYKYRKLTKNNGIWKGKSYSHILPKDQYKSNIIEEFRKEFWEYFTNKNIELHHCFHHLNSSQALCFNLFFPLIKSKGKLFTYLLHRIIEIPPAQNLNPSEIDLNNATQLDEKFLKINPVKKVEFERVLDPLEGTNFDLYVELTKQKRVLFELKYTENKFGSAKMDSRHIDKIDDIYFSKLSPLLNSDYLTHNFILHHYQIVRNLSFIDSNTTIVFIYPRNNEKLFYVKPLLYKILKQEYYNNIRVIHLEDLLRQILDKNIYNSLWNYYQEFREKYNLKI